MSTPITYILHRVTLLLLAAFTALILRLVYNIYFHPLRNYPGPKLAAASRLPLVIANMRGEQPFWTHKLHEKYGPVVRVAPHQLSYTDGQTTREILGHLKGDGEMPKDLRESVVGVPPNGVASIFSADRANHARQRKLMAHAFSEKALREQEDTIAAYVDKFVAKLGGLADQGKNANVVEWLNFLTFDIISDLSFGESFNSLNNAAHHPFVTALVLGIKSAPYMQTLAYYNLSFLLRWLTPKSLFNARILAARDSYAKVDGRLANKDTQRKDFLSYILRYNDARGMSLGEIHSNAHGLIIAGSETTATLLSAALFYLNKNPAVRDALVTETRGQYASDGDISMHSTAKQQLLNAVIEESLRMYPPVPGHQLRLVPAGGAVIAGQFVPGNTSVGVHQWSTFHSADNFHQPDRFLPERWFPEAATDATNPFYADKRSALQPFSFGARACLGRNLAYAEMRLVLAKLVFNFDMELDGGSTAWTEGQKVFVLWDKPSLMLKLRKAGGQ